MCPNIDVASRGVKLVEGKPEDTDQWCGFVAPIRHRIEGGAGDGWCNVLGDKRGGEGRISRLSIVPSTRTRPRLLVISGIVQQLNC